MEGSGKTFHLTAESESATVPLLTEISKTHHTQEQNDDSQNPLVHSGSGRSRKNRGWQGHGAACGARLAGAIRVNRDKLPKLNISRTHVHATIEIYFEGEIIGDIIVDPAGSHRAILHIAAPKFLRFVRAEIDQERKDKIIFPDRPNVPRRTSKDTAP